MAKTRPMTQPSKASHRQAVAKALDDYLSTISRALAPIDYALGGAMAMAEYGYRRATDDVDVFVTEENLSSALRRLADAGMNIETAFSGLHYVAYRPRHELHPDVRIDVLAVYDDPEWSAASAPDELTTPEGLTLKIIPLDLLVLSRFYSQQQRHQQDLAAMIERQMVDVRRVSQLLHIMDRSAVPRWRQVYDRLSRPARPPARPSRRVSS